MDTTQILVFVFMILGPQGYFIYRRVQAERRIGKLEKRVEELEKAKDTTSNK